MKEIFVSILVVTLDLGGLVSSRVDYIDSLDRTLVRIEGYCASSCTMYLGAEHVCVTPEARLVFHGPSFFGLPLPEYDFDYWSRVISSYYPEVIRDWYMEEGRYGNYTLTGEHLIEMGARECLHQN